MKLAEGASSFQHSEMRDGGIGRTEDGLRSEARSRGETAQNSLWLRDCISLDVERGVVTEVSLIFPDVSMRPPGSDTRQQRSDGKIQRSIRRSEDRDAASSVFRGSAEGKAATGMPSFRPPATARPPHWTLSSKKLLPSSRFPYAGRSKQVRLEVGGVAQVVPCPPLSLPQRADVLVDVRSCPAPAAPAIFNRGSIFSRWKLFPLLPLVTAQRSGNLRLRRHRDHLPTMLGACQCAHGPRTRECRETFGWLRGEWAPHFNMNMGQSSSGHGPLSNPSHPSVIFSLHACTHRSAYFSPHVPAICPSLHTYLSM